MRRTSATPSASGATCARLLLTKGVNHQANTPFIEDPLQRKQRLRNAEKRLCPFLIGNVAAMALITQRLNLPRLEPVEAALATCTFPRETRLRR